MQLLLIRSKFCKHRLVSWDAKSGTYPKNFLTPKRWMARPDDQEFPRLLWNLKLTILFTVEGQRFLS